MCLRDFRVRSLSYYGVKRVFVPCGKCEDCRRSMQSAWTTRLKAEIEEYHVHQKYNVGFVTLTYCNRRLPRIPKRFFKDGEYKKIPCFNYKHIKRFCDTIRNYLFRDLGLTNAFRFFCTCEYGEKFHRPHYHLILLYHKSIAPEKMYKIVEDCWCGSSQVVPQPRCKQLRRRFLGIIAPFSSFVPRDPQACGVYVAKYVCKDLAFEDTTSDYFDHLTRSQRNDFRHYSPFHKQSLGFGRCLVDGKTDAELFDVLANGVQFTGYPETVTLPSYLVDKILFRHPRIYNRFCHYWQTHKFYSKFFMENRDRVFLLKFNSLCRMLMNMDSYGYWTERGMPHLYFEAHSVFLRNSIEDLALFYLTYFGVPSSRCHVALTPSDWYCSRFDPYVDWSDFPKVDPVWHKYMSQELSFLLSLSSLPKSVKRSESDKIIADVRAFFNNLNLNNGDIYYAVS